MKFNNQEYKKTVQQMENLLDPVHPTQSVENIEILGYGEISTVIGITFEDSSSWACKRLPIFSSEKQSKDYIALYKDYNKELKNLGLNVPDYDGIDILGHDETYVNYLFQQRLDEESICHKVIHKVSPEEKILLLELIVLESAKVWRFNEQGTALNIGLDAQLSNWAIKNYSEANLRIDESTELYFIDTSTPFIRKNGEELIDGRLLLKSAPNILQPLLAKLFLDDVIGRYYNFRDVIIDLLANLHKEQVPDIIEPALNKINALFHGELNEFEMEPITMKEIIAYYKEDKFIWNLYMGVRKLDRFIKTKLMGKRYEFVLPGNIKR